MAKPLDSTVMQILRKYDLDPKEALWDCHGVWVVYHRYLERAAAKAGVRFDKPIILNYEPEVGIAMIITGNLNETSEWSIGEASPNNNKNVYPWAMAEKRGKDRVILKLLGLHGFVYSEEEADEFKENRPKEQAAVKTNPEIAYAQLFETLQEPFWDRKKLLAWWNSDESRTARRNAGLSKEMISDLRTEIERLHPKEVDVSQKEANPQANQANNSGKTGL